MPVTLCVLLWSVPGNEDELVGYEDLVLARLATYGGRVLHRVRRDQTSQSPYEVQVIELPTQDALTEFMADPERLGLADMRARAVERTEIIRVTVVPT